MERYDRQPKEIWLDLAATDDPLPGNQQGQFFHGYYGHTGYLLLSFLCGEPVLCARLREGVCGPGGWQRKGVGADRDADAQQMA